MKSKLIAIVATFMLISVNAYSDQSLMPGGGGYVIQNCHILSCFDMESVKSKQNVKGKEPNGSG